MGGIGFISSKHAHILYNNTIINFHCLEAARRDRVKRYLYSSWACVCSIYRPRETDVVPLTEEHAYPADP